MVSLPHVTCSRADVGCVDDRPVVLRRTLNPRLFALKEVSKITGLTGQELLLTPRAQKRQPPMDVEAIVGLAAEGKRQWDELQGKKGTKRR